MTIATNTTRSPADPRSGDLTNLSDAAAELGLSLNALRRRVEKAGIAVYLGADARERLIHRRELDRWRGVRRLESYRAS